MRAPEPSGSPPGPVPPGALGRDSLARLLREQPPLVEGIRDLAAQLQPNGIDLTVEAIWRLVGPGALGTSERGLPERAAVEPGADGWYTLDPGAYIVLLHERVQLPPNLMGLSWPRSTMLRCGAQVHTAVWDAGYSGQPETLLVVSNPQGMRLGATAGICQLVFFSLTETVAGYSGAYQGK